MLRALIALSAVEMAKPWAKGTAREAMTRSDRKSMTGGVEGERGKGGCRKAEDGGRWKEANGASASTF